MRRKTNKTTPRINLMTLDFHSNLIDPRTLSANRLVSTRLKIREVMLKRNTQEQEVSQVQRAKDKLRMANILKVLVFLIRK